MKLSVVIPFRNAADTIGDQLEALAAQHWDKPWEIIAADNGSTDASRSVVEKFMQRLPHLSLVDASQRRGIPHARNRAVRVARGEAIAFCDADDVVAPGWVAAMGEALAGHEFVASRLDTFKLNPSWIPWLDRHPQLRGLQQAPYPPYALSAGGGTLGIRKSLFEAVGGFDEAFPCLEDHEFCHRLAARGVRLRYVPEAVIHLRHRHTLQGMFGQARQWGQWHVRVYKRYRDRSRRQWWCWRVYARDCWRLARNAPRLHTQTDRAGWMWRLGLQVGLLQGSLRYGAPPAPFISNTYVEGESDGERESERNAAPAHGPLVRLLRKPFSFVARRMMGTISHVRTREAVAALTFDDGPDADSTPRLLDLLERHGARGTFFMLGCCAAENPELVRRIAAAGHAIGNHSWDHPSFAAIASGERRRQLRACAQTLAPHGVRLFRPPFGEQSVASRIDAFRLGFQVVTWSVDVEDWCERDSGKMADGVLKRIRRGSIVLFHDHLFRGNHARLAVVSSATPQFDREPMLRAVETVLKRLAGQYEFVTVPELLRRGKPARRNWYVTRPSDWARIHWPS